MHYILLSNNYHYKFRIGYKFHFNCKLYLVLIGTDQNYEIAIIQNPLFYAYQHFAGRTGNEITINENGIHFYK